jgi:hypothetical protein
MQSMFSDAARRLEKQIGTGARGSVACWELEAFEEAHHGLRRYMDLARVLEALDPAQFAALRDRYIAAFRKPYAAQIKAFFSAAKNLILPDVKVPSRAPPSY